MSNENHSDSSKSHSKVGQSYPRPTQPAQQEQTPVPALMARRLRKRLFQARLDIERDIGHALTTIVPPTSRHCRVYTRSHLFPHGGHLGTFVAKTSASNNAVELLFHKSPGNHGLELPSSPEFGPRTRSPLYNDNDAARTILMLATPPPAAAATRRFSPMAESPCRSRLKRLPNLPASGRRLSFSRYLGDLNSHQAAKRRH